MDFQRQEFRVFRDMLGFVLAGLVSFSAQANPSGATVVSGSAAFSQNGTSFTVTNSPNAIIDWQSFNIQANESTRFVQQSAASAVLNRVVGADPSQILGTLQSNGRVFLVNPAGIFVGQGARIDVAGLVASTLNISNEDFLAGRMKFQGVAGAGNVINRGSIAAQYGGTVYLVAPNVENSGIIRAPGGEILLAAGETVQLLNTATPDVSIEITGKPGNATNIGQILSDAGHIGLEGAVIRNEALISADSVVNEGGHVFLRAREVINSGNVGSDGAAGGSIEIRAGEHFTQMAGGALHADSRERGNGGRISVISSGDAGIDGRISAMGGANGGDGGFIETSAANVRITDNAKITTTASNGKTGTWLIDPTDYTIAASGGDITGAALAANLGTSNVTILSSSGAGGISGNINVNDTVTWSLNKLTLNAQNNININATMNASGTASLALEYGQGAVAAGNTSTYNVKAPVNLASTSGFSTKLGSDGLVTNYTVINSLGAAGSVTGTDLQGMQGGILAGNYALGSNIDATATSTWNAGAGFAPVGTWGTPFLGRFNGLGHTITGLTINRPTTDAVGLFGGDTGTISNVGLVGGSMRGRNYVGGLAGANGGTITNSYSTGSVTGSGSWVGGLAGNNTGTITNSYATGTVTGVGYVGGLVGNNNSLSFATITNSYSTGSVTGSGSWVGGLAGYNNGTISNSYSTGSVTGSVDIVGGLVGINTPGSTITNSYSTGAVSNTSATGWDVGGLVGYNWSGTITNSYSTGSVTGSGTNVGGLVGLNSGTITNSYWDTQTSGRATSAGGTGLTTAQMMQSANFTGFDFTNVWWLSAGDTRPFLRSEWSNTITNAHQLQLMSMNLGASYTLANNIDLTSSLAAVGGLYPGMWGSAGFVPVGVPITIFTGAFDGLGHTITGLTINRPAQSYVGLFGYTANNAAIRNVGLVGGSITGNMYVGGLAGQNAGTISNSYSTATVNMVSVDAGEGGGLAGDNTGTITNSYNTGTVNNSVGATSVNVGGLVGNNFGTIANSYNTGTVTNVNGGWEVGGLAGSNSGTITNSYNTGSVTGSSYVGGLAGNSWSGTITNSYSTGSVTGTTYVGGLVGYNGNAITNSYSAGTVSGTTNVGGLVGWNNVGTITNSYWDTTTSGQATSSGGTGLTTAQMKTMASFTGWSIVNTGGSNAVWRIYEGHTYPLLKSFLTPLTLTGAPDVAVTYNGAAQSGGTFTLIPNVLGASATGTNTGFYNGYYSTQQGYDITGGNLTINPASLTLLNLAANNASKTYGAALTFTGTEFTPVGLLNGDTISSVTLTSAGAVATANAGAYAITPSNAVFSVGNAGNYNIAYVNGVLTVNPAPLTVTANNASKTYNGLAYTGGNGVIYTGFVNGETSAVLGGALSFSGASQGAINAGSYTIVPGGLTSGNYTITYNNGALTVNPATLTITGVAANNKVYDGTTTAALSNTGNLSGLVNGETLTLNAPTSVTFADKNAGTGKTVTATGYTIGNGTGLAYNYQLGYSSATTTADITPAPLTLTANNAGKTYDGLGYSGGNGVSGFFLANGETPTVLGGALAYGGTSQGAINPGSYTIIPSGLTSTNYAISFVNGTLTITSAASPAATAATAISNTLLADTLKPVSSLPGIQNPAALAPVVDAVSSLFDVQASPQSALTIVNASAGAKTPLDACP